jgi:hypothetical protein
MRLLWSRGVRHKVRCSVQRKEPVRDLGMVAAASLSALTSHRFTVRSALNRIESLIDLWDVKATVTTSEALALLPRLASAFEERTSVLRLLSVVAGILASEQIIWDYELPVEGGDCRFCNTDRLWEITSHRVAESCAQADDKVELHPIRNSGLIVRHARCPPRSSVCMKC